jgi:PAS domain S-box-containing protein
MRSIASGEAIVDEEFLYIDPDGIRTTYRCNCSPVYDKGGRIVAAVSITRDVTEENRAEQLFASHARLLETVPDAVVGTDADFRVTVWNSGAERLYGYTAEEALGRHAREIASYPGDTSRLDLEAELLEADRARRELTAYRKDGRPVVVELIAAAISGGDGELTGYIGVHRDMTERKRAEKAVRDSQRRLETVLESITDAFVAVDRDWRYTYVNDRALRRMRRRTGRELRREDVLGLNMWDLTPDSVGTELHRRYQEAMGRRHPVEFETFHPPSGEWLEAHAYPSEGGLSIYYRDVTERRLAEEERRESQSRTDTILESITDAFYLLDSDWRFAYLNERAVDVLGDLLGRRLTREDLLGESVWETLPATLGTDTEVNFRRAVREHETIVYEDLYPVGDRWFDIHVYPTEDGLSVYFREITARKRTEEERERAVRQQALVAELGLRALASDDIGPLIDEAVALVARTLETELVAVAEILPGEDHMLMRAGVGWRDGVVGTVTGAAGPDSMVGYAIMAGEPVVSEDLSAEDRFQVSQLVSEHRAASGAAVLIGGLRGPFGALGVFSRQRRPFSAGDVDFLQAVANVLATAVERLQAAQDAFEVRDNERRRIARDLHDEALQGLTDALAQAGDTAVASTLRRVAQQLRAAIYDLRLRVEEGRPFPELLQALVALHGAMAVDCEVELHLGDGIPPGTLGARGTEVLRVMGEALVNARRHAAARNIRVEAWGSDERLCVEVSDDGRGLPPGSEAGGGAGITGMRERAAALDAKLDVEQRPGGGTVVRLGLPLGPARDAAQGRTHVLLVEDHATVREALAAMLEREPDIAVVGQAASLRDARQLLAGVDVALVDLGLPDGYGGDLIGELRAVNPRAQALVLSASLDHSEVARAVESGAAGALDKTARLDEVVSAVRRLRAGETLLPMDEVVELLRFAGRRREQERDDRLAIEGLTPREREVLQGLADGLDSQAIADRLHITLRTERNHVANILAKLGVHSQLQALVFALRYEVVELR